MCIPNHVNAALCFLCLSFYAPLSEHILPSFIIIWSGITIIILTGVVLNVELLIHCITVELHSSSTDEDTGLDNIQAWLTEDKDNYYILL